MDKRDVIYCVVLGSENKFVQPVSLISHYCDVSPRRKELVTSWIQSRGGHCSQQGSELQITLLRLFWNTSDGKAINWSLTERPGSIHSITTPKSAVRPTLLTKGYRTFFLFAEVKRPERKASHSPHYCFTYLPIEHNHHPTILHSYNIRIRDLNKWNFQAVNSHELIKNGKKAMQAEFPAFLKR